MGRRVPVPPPPPPPPHIHHQLLLHLFLPLAPLHTTHMLSETVQVSPAAVPGEANAVARSGWTAPKKRKNRACWSAPGMPSREATRTPGGRYDHSAAPASAW